MVTFLVSLVVVGGAAILILRVTLEDAVKPATDDDGSHGAVAPGAVAPGAVAVAARRASAFLVPSDGDDPGHPRRARPEASSSPDGERRATSFLIPVGAPQGRTPAGSPEPPAQVAEAPADPSPRGVSVAPDDPTGELDLDRTGPLDVHARTLQEGAPHQGAQDQVLAGRGGLDTTIAAPAVADLARNPVPARPARPPFRRRLLQRVLGAVKLVLLLVLTGSLLAATLGLAVVVVMVGVRAAIGS